MAISVANMHDVAYAVATQSSWGTALAGSAGFASPSGMRLDAEPAAFDPDAKVREPNRSMAGYRHRDYTARILDSKGSSPGISFSGVLKKVDLAHMLYSVIQNVSESAVTPYAKTFTFPSTQPDFTANAGWFATVQKRHPTVSDSQAMADAIGTELVLRWDEPDSAGTFDWTLRGRGPLDYAFNSTGTLTPNTTSGHLFYLSDVITVTGAGAALHPVSLEIRFSNNAMPASVEQNSAGKFLTWALTEYQCSAKIKVLWTPTAQNLQDNVYTQSPGTWIIEWGSTDVDGNLKLTLIAQPGPAPDEDGDVNTINFDLTCVGSGGSAPVTVVLADDTDRTW